MAKNIFTVRHGEAIHQVNPGIWSMFSNREISLTPLGKRQAEECGRFFADMHLDPDKTLVIASPFCRATETAELIIKENPTLKMVEEPLLTEQNFGLFTGLTTEQCYEQYPALAKLYDLQAERDGDYLVKPPQGETKKDVVTRAEQFIEKISPWFLNSKYENLLVVSHCVMSRAICKVLNNESPEWFLKLKPLPNCSIEQFSHQNGKWTDKGLVFVPKEQGKNITLACPEHLKGKGAEYE